MPSVYGDMLPFFTEQMRTVKYFELTPDPAAGYSHRTAERTVRGIFQFVKPSVFKRENEVLADVDFPTFWCKERLRTGAYLELPGEGDKVFRIKDDDMWKFEGGFVIHPLETVTGVTDVQVPHEGVKLGTGSYG